MATKTAKPKEVDGDLADRLDAVREGMMTLKDAAKFSGISARQLYVLRKKPDGSGFIRFGWNGSKRAVSKADLLLYMATNLD